MEKKKSTLVKWVLLHIVLMWAVCNLFLRDEATLLITICPAIGYFVALLYWFAIGKVKFPENYFADIRNIIKYWLLAILIGGIIALPSAFFDQYPRYVIPVCVGFVTGSLFGGCQKLLQDIKKFVRSR